MNQHDGFFQAIIEHPDDDTPRLVYADWLDEHNQPARAEFIRLQVRLAGGAAPAEEVPALRRREHELLLAHEMEWTAPLHGLVQRARFKRGFVERVTLLREDFIERGADLFRIAPIRHVVLTDRERTLKDVAACPWLQHVETLDFRTLGSKETIRPLAQSPHLGRLTGLLLRFGAIDDKGAGILGSQAFARLRTLDLYGSQFHPKGLALLTGSPHLSQLETLVLNDNEELNEEAAEALTGPGMRLTALTTLCLGFCRLFDAGVQVLAAEPRLASLRTLDLKDNGIGADGARALASSPHLQGLTLLDLSGNAVTPRGRRQLVDRFGDRVRV